MNININQNYYDFLNLSNFATSSAINEAKIRVLLEIESAFLLGNIDKNICASLISYLHKATKTLLDPVKRKEYNKSLLNAGDKSILEYEISRISNKELEKEKPNVKLEFVLKFGAIELTNERYESNPAIGRESEIEKLELSLVTPDKSAIIVGEAGVGKSSIANGLAYLIDNGNVPNRLKNIRIFRINAAAIVAGTCYRGDFEQSLIKLLEELKEHKDIILFIDEIHMIMKAGDSSDSAMNFANIIKPYLDRDGIKIIGATTEDEYQRYILQDEALKRRFTKVVVREPDLELCSQILTGSIPFLEKENCIAFNIGPIPTYHLMEYIAEITSKQFRMKNDNQNNPDLALSILNDAFAYSIVKDKTTVDIEEIIKAIKNCERIAPEYRIKFATELFNKWDSSFGSNFDQIQENKYNSN